MESILSTTEKLLSDYLIAAGCTPAVKFLDKHLCEMGDAVIKSKTDLELHFDAKALIEASNRWLLPITTITFVETAVQIRFNRAEAFRKTLTAMEWLPLVRKVGAVKIYIEEPTTDTWDTMSLTEYRTNIMRKVTKNCLIHAGYMIVEKAPLADENTSDEVKHIKFVKQKNKTALKQDVEILCGPVLTGTDVQNVSQYIGQRSNEMQLIAQHRYGLRVPDRTKLEHMVASLGRSVAIVDMLHTKQSSAIDLRPLRSNNRTQSSSKEAAFILYNYARLRSIFQKHAVLLEQQGLTDIPPLEETNLSLLTETDEWELLYAYLIQFPRAIRQTVGYGQPEHIAPYHLLNFTLHLVKCLSKYYCRTKILTENRPKLQPVMYARLHLLRAVSGMLKVLLNLLDLETIEEM